MVPINTYSIVLAEIHAKQKWLLKVLAHMMNVCSNCLSLISNVTFTIPLGHKLIPSTCPTHNCISTICALSDIWLYNGKEIQEQVALVSNNAVTGSVLNNFTSKVANLPGDGCMVDTMCFVAHKFLSHSSVI